MESNVFVFTGLGPYSTTTTESLEVLVMENKNSGNYMFSLKTEEYGPVIVDSDFERGKLKFKKALEKMLIFRSILSLSDARELAANDLKEKYPLVHSGVDDIKSKHSSDERIIKLAEMAKRKLKLMVEDVDTNLVIQ